MCVTRGTYTLREKSSKDGMGNVRPGKDARGERDEVTTDL